MWVEKVSESKAATIYYLKYPYNILFTLQHIIYYTIYYLPYNILFTLQYIIITLQYII